MQRVGNKVNGDFGEQVNVALAPVKHQGDIGAVFRHGIVLLLWPFHPSYGFPKI